MAYSSNIVKTKRDGKVTLTDGAGNSYIADFAVGDFTWEHAKPELIVIYDRNTIRGARNGNDPQLTLSWTCHQRALTSSSADVLLDVCQGSRGATTLTSTGGTGFEPFMLSVIFEEDATSLGDASAYTATFAKCQLTASVTEGEPNSISISAVCLGGVTYA